MCYFCQPAVAVGNVGQLAVDLIVSTLNMTRVGFIHTDCLIPMAGNNPYTTCKEDAEKLHTPAEGNQSKLKNKLFMIYMYYCECKIHIVEYFVTMAC